MIDEKRIRKLWAAWIFTCFLGAILSFKFPLPDRPEEIRLILFSIIAAAMFLFWHLACVFLFSTVGLSIISSLPREFIKKNTKQLNFLKFISTKEAFQKYRQCTVCSEN